MPGAYFVKPKRVTWRSIVGDDMSRLNDNSSAHVIYKIGSTTQLFIEDRTRSYGEYEVIDEWETSRAGGVYIEQDLRDNLIALGYKNWQNKKDHFMVHRKDIDAFVTNVRRICMESFEEITEMEKRLKEKRNKFLC
jgi:hypothetical protein